MNRRERVIVGFMVLAGLYGAYDFLFGAGGPTGAGGARRQDAELQQFVNEVTSKMALPDDSPAKDYILERARQSDPWPQDPFAVADTAAITVQGDVQETGAGVRADFAYTGYVALGERRMAIVNGVEYFEGETLANSGYLLYRVGPGEVEVRAIDGEQRRIVPLTEDEAQ